MGGCGKRNGSIVEIGDLKTEKHRESTTWSEGGNYMFIEG